MRGRDQATHHVGVSQHTTKKKRKIGCMGLSITSFPVPVSLPFCSFLPVPDNTVPAPLSRHSPHSRMSRTQFGSQASLMQRPCIAQHADDGFSGPPHMHAGDQQVVMCSYNRESTGLSGVSALRFDHLLGTYLSMHQARTLKQQIKVSTTHCAHPSSTPRWYGKCWKNTTHSCVEPT